MLGDFYAVQNDQAKAAKYLKIACDKDNIFACERYQSVRDADPANAEFEKEYKLYASSIQRPSLDMQNNGRRYYFSLQSKSESTIINKITINRGACNIKLAEINNESLQDYWKEHKYITNYDGSRSENAPRVVYSGKGGSLEAFFGLSGEAQWLYDFIYPKTLKFGERFNFDFYDCAPNEVLEVKVETNGGEFVYNFGGK